jgi:hypothetical protein
MMTADQFRKLALSFEDASEQSHMGHPDFRVRGKIFATLGYPDKDWAMVKLSPEQQQELVDTEPKIFVPVKGEWGRRGSTNVHLTVATRQKVAPALEAAWRNAAAEG